MIPARTPQPEVCVMSLRAPTIVPGPTKLPKGFDAPAIVRRAANTYGVALGEVAGKVFRIGHPGSLTGVMRPSRLARLERCMADIGSGVAAAQEFFRRHPANTAREVA